MNIILQISTSVIICFLGTIAAVKVIPDFDYKKSDYEFKRASVSKILAERLDQLDKDITASPERNDTLFGHMLQKHFPMEYIYEDDKCVAFYDDPPQAPVHVVIITRKGLRYLQDAREDDKELLGHLLLTANKIALDLGLKDGYRVIINNGKDACQLIKHFQVHVLGGRQLYWPCS